MRKTSTLRFVLLPLVGMIASICSGCTNHEHKFSVVEMIEPTCVNKGVKKHLVCELCGDVFSINTKEKVNETDLEISPLGHDFEKPGVYIRYPSCLENGIVSEKCYRCDATNEIEVPKYDTHSYTQEIISDEYLYELGDCTHKSIYYKSCACGKKSEVEFFEGDYFHNAIHHQQTDQTNNREGNADFYECDDCGEYLSLVNGKYVSFEGNPYFGKQINLYRKNGSVQKVLPDYVIDYLNLVDDPATKNNEIAEYMYKNEAKFGPNEGAKPITISWSCEEGIVAPFKVILYKDANLTNEVARNENITGNSTQFKNLIPGEYFYIVKDGNDVSSMVDSFTFNTSLRAINTGNTIINFRDLGGWVNKNSQTIKYGNVYRSADWYSNSANLDITINSLNIKTEIDVRLNHSVSSHPLNGVSFINTGFTDDYSSMLTDPVTISNIKTFMSILADSSNYPLVYHCSAGADRTGLGSLLIESVLGLKDEDIYRDYELTSFFNEKRLRSDVILDDENNYKFNPDGLLDLTGWKAQFGRITTFYLEPYKDEGDSIADCIVKFLVNRVGVTVETLNQIRSNLLN